MILQHIVCEMQAWLPRFRMGGWMLAWLGCVACHDLVGSAALPPGTQSPNTYSTPDGALAMYRGVKANLAMIRTVITASGALTDELTAQGIGAGPGDIGAVGDPTDERLSTGTSDNGTYGGLQQIRGSSMEALGLLGAYAPATSPALRGEMYAIRGYAEVLLAELYCSGVPLSTLDFQGDFTYQPGSTQQAVYQHAVTLFDSALAISSDSVSVMAFARVAKGRALLDLGRYDSAALAVAAVPDTFRYQVPLQVRTSSGYFLDAEHYSVATHEGINGLPFVTASDPRVQVTQGRTNRFGISTFYPSKYPVASAIASVVLASGVEARLIQAEAALQTHPNDGQWLTILNTLRTTCTTATACPTPAPAGTGGVAGLPPLDDPGTLNARADTLFRERADWLFLTGHRQGDLRRLVRNYDRAANTVYPAGPYYGGLGVYGSAVNLQIPDEELDNPKFHGCLDRSA